MTSKRISFANLSDDDLLAEVKRLAATERRATSALIRSLMELDARRLYLGEGCSSLFSYCTQVLHLAEGAAYNRIEAARAARRFPLVIDGLEDGSLTLTTVRLLSPHLTDRNVRDVVSSARYKSKRDIEILVASLSPKPTVPATIRKLPDSRQRPAETIVRATSVAASEENGRLSLPDNRSTAGPLAMVVPLAPSQFKVQLTISNETHEKLRRVQALVRHAIPTGDLATILDRALTLLLGDLEKRRCAVTVAQRASRAPKEESRHIPAAVRREVWRRDDGRCAFVGRQGRCTERGFLEFHHVRPFAAGGTATAMNIQLRCRAHNAYEASLFFGSDGSELAREAKAPYAANALSV